MRVSLFVLPNIKCWLFVSQLNPPSLVLASGEATPAPTLPPLPPNATTARPPLEQGGSLEYPEGYDPLTDSGKCWDEGKQQVRSTVV